MKRPRKYFKNTRIRKDYYNYFDICKIEGISETRAKNAIKDKGVEGIKHLEELKPIEHLFVVFERPIKGRIVNSYGILRRYYDDWKATGQVPSPPPGRPKKEGFVNVKYNIPLTLREEFNSVVDTANSMSVVHVTYSDMAAVALKEFCQRRPQFANLDKD